jgi:hypothetical protein
VDGFRQVHQDAHSVMLRRLGNQNPQVIPSHGRTPYKRIPDFQADQPA